jgi:glycerol-3-phosphate dehydrogenase
MEKLSARFPAKPAWTHKEPLPGGDLGGKSFRGLLLEYRRRFPRLPKLWVARLLRRHGALAGEIIGEAREERGLGRNFGGGLYERELEYLVKNEWVREAEDALWRRTKCGLHMNAAQQARVRDWLGKRV